MTDTQVAIMDYIQSHPNAINLPPEELAKAVINEAVSNTHFADERYKKALMEGK